MNKDSFPEEMKYKIEVLKEKKSKDDLYRIRFNQLLILIEDLKKYKPKSKVRSEKSLIIEYVDLLIDCDVERLTKVDILKLEAKYVIPIITKFDRLNIKGYAIENTWFLVFLIFFVLDAVLIATRISKWYLNIPIFSIIVVISFLIKEYKAKKNEKLW